MTTETSILKQLSACIESNGEDKTLELLKDATGHGTKAIVDFCIHTISQVLQVPAKLFSTTQRKDARTAGIGFCVYFLHEVYSITFPELEKKLPFKMGSRSLRKYKQKVLYAKIEKPKSSIDKLIAQHKNDLEQIFTNHKNQTPA